MERVYRNSTRLFGVLMVFLGVAMIVSALVAGGGPASFGVVLGVLFAALGAARFYLSGHPRDER